MKSFVKKDDTVLVITGKDKGKQGKVLGVATKEQKVLVENVNVVTKHKKPRSQEDKGGRVTKPAYFDASNVMVVCPACNKATRIARKEVAGDNARICKKCGASLDKKFTKIVKKEKKVADKAVQKQEKAVKEPKNAETKLTSVKSEVKKPAAKIGKTQAAKTTVKSPVKKAAGKSK